MPLLAQRSWYRTLRGTADCRTIRPCQQNGNNGPECHGHGGGRAIPVLGHDQVRLARPRRLLLILVFAVQQDNDVAILLYTIMKIYSISDKVMSSEDCRIINWLMSDTLDREMVSQNTSFVASISSSASSRTSVMRPIRVRVGQILALRSPRLRVPTAA